MQNNDFREKMRMIVSDRKNIFKKYCKILLNFYVSDFRKIEKLKKL